MSKKEQTVSVKVNPAERNGTNRDEVAIHSLANDADPYINRMVYAKPGMFTDGDLSLGEVERLEVKSAKALADELATTLDREAKEREEAAKVVVDNKTEAKAKKSEG